MIFEFCVPQESYLSTQTNFCSEKNSFNHFRLTNHVKTITIRYFDNFFLLESRPTCASVINYPSITVSKIFSSSAMILLALEVHQDKVLVWYDILFTLHIFFWREETINFYTDGINLKLFFFWKETLCASDMILLFETVFRIRQF